MSQIVDIIKDVWFRKPPAAMADVTALAHDVAVTLPQDYIDLLLWSNGGEATLGTAYIAMWPIQDVARRNRSASISTYMGRRFIGIGTNGGDELYALDYTQGDTPSLAIVPLGDLDPASTFTIAASLSEGMQKAIDGQFDDGQYNALAGGVLSDELMHIRMTKLRMTAEKAWQQKDYQQFVTLLNVVQDQLTPVEKRKFDLATSTMAP